MPMYVDNMVTYPPGTFHTDNVDGDTWCHLVSSDSLVAFTTFLDDNPSLGVASASVRTPALGSKVTYVGLTEAQRTAAVAAGALEVSGRECFARAFDAPASGRGTYE